MLFNLSRLYDLQIDKSCISSEFIHGLEDCLLMRFSGLKSADRKLRMLVPILMLLPKYKIGPAELKGPELPDMLDKAFGSIRFSDTYQLANCLSG